MSPELLHGSALGFRTLVVSEAPSARLPVPEADHPHRQRTGHLGPVTGSAHHTYCR